MKGVNRMRKYSRVFSRRWDLTEMFSEQFKTDTKYLREAGLTSQETFEKRKLALWVELGELINEWKELFKFWNNKRMDRAKALEEYVDCLHFLLSLGNDLKIYSPYYDLVVMVKDPIDHIFTLSERITTLRSGRDFYEVFALFRGLGDHLGFTEAEIEKAYFEKDKINRKRKDHIGGGS